MKTIIHKAESRGHAELGWLKSHHSFSFGDFHDPARVHFGALRVLNDDTVSGGQGFGMHSHDNMEIITIPLSGDLEHKDSIGNQAIIKSGDVQVMSAGTGIHHSEYNKSKDQPVKFLQIWVIPDKKQVKPRYDQISLDQSSMTNRLIQIVSPDPADAGVWLHQQAWFHLGKFEQASFVNYDIKKPGNGVYIFVLSGPLEVEGTVLSTRDAIGLWETETVRISSAGATEYLIIEVPMQE